MNPKQNPHTNQRKPKQTHTKKMKPTENPKAFIIQIQQKERNREDKEEEKSRERQTLL